MASYAGTYRIHYAPNGERFLEVRRVSGAYVRIGAPIPAHVRGCYAAANYFKV